MAAPTEAGKLEDQISKLLEHGPQTSRMQQLAQKLGQCSKSSSQWQGRSGSPVA